MRAPPDTGRNGPGAAGLSISYESLSRDYSQSNYSSSRLSLLDDRDVWRSLQQWFIRSFREPLHREWLQVAVMSRSIPEVPTEQYGAEPERFLAVLFKPRGWSWVDPTKEVEAYKEAIKAGFTTTSRIIAATADGLDLEDVITAARPVTPFALVGISQGSCAAIEYAVTHPENVPHLILYGGYAKG